MLILLAQEIFKESTRNTLKVEVNIMKKIILLLVVFFCLCGCGENKLETSELNNNISSDILVSSAHEESKKPYETNIKNEDKDLAYTIVTKSDYNKLATTFNELIQDADIILKIKVLHASPFVANNAMIRTEITPEVQEVCKGIYNGEKLYVNGGEMLYDNFIKHEQIKKVISGHESTNQKYTGMYVQQKVDNQYIFDVGDEYIFFAKKREDSQRYYSLYAYQGTFKIVDGNVENSALSNAGPLKQDIYKSLGYEFETSGVVNKESKAPISNIPLKHFINKINEFK